MASVRPTYGPDLQPLFLIMLREEGAKVDSFEDFLPMVEMQTVLSMLHPGSEAEPGRRQGSPVPGQHHSA